MRYTLLMFLPQPFNHVRVEAHLFLTLLQSHLFRRSWTSSYLDASMNALDSLFDFAALMSTSSAMTLTPNPNNVSVVPTQDARTSQVPSATAVPAQVSQSRERMQHHPQQLGGGMHSLPRSENNVAIFSGAQVNSGNQHSVDWAPAPPFMQQTLVQDCYPPMPEHSRLPLYEVPTPDCDVPCGHHPIQRCNCKYMLPLSRRYQQGSIAPNAWNNEHLLLRHLGLQHSQQSLADGFPCEGQVPGQMSPPHGFCINDNCVPVVPYSTDLQYGSLDIGLHPENMADFVPHY
jgi:hypothetical protein